MAAYRRADERGDALAAYNLGLLLKGEGDRTGALRALQRAYRLARGSADIMRAASAALSDLSPAEGAERPPDDQGEAAAVSEPDSAARPPTRRGNQAW
jgi:TPR repeat protein